MNLTLDTNREELGEKNRNFCKQMLLTRKHRHTSLKKECNILSVEQLLA